MPAVQAIDKPVEAVGRTNATLATQIGNLRVSLAAAGAAAAEAETRARTLAESGNATKAELVQAYRDWQAERATRNMFEEMATAAETTNKQQAKEIEELRTTVRAASIAAQASEIEKVNLRQSVKDANQATKDATDTANGLVTERDEWKRKYERAAPFEKAAWILGIGAALYLALRITKKTAWGAAKLAFIP
jgi:chromosome segregation ATPase